MVMVEANYGSVPSSSGLRDGNIAPTPFHFNLSYYSLIPYAPGRRVY